MSLESSEEDEEEEEDEAKEKTKKRCLKATAQKRKPTSKSGFSVNGRATLEEKELVVDETQ